MRALSLRITMTLGLLAGMVVVATASSGAAETAKAAPKYQYGINTYFTYNCQGYSTIESWARTEFAQVKALRANTIAIAFPLYTDSITSNSIYAKLVCGNAKYQTPPADLMGAVVDIAHADGLQVFLRPLLDQATLYAQGPNYWRGVLAPTNLNAWFTNYLVTLRPYLLMAQAHHVEHLSISTELNSLSHAPNWSSAITIVHRLYQGDLAFDWSWFTTVVKIPHTATSTAIDTYPGIVASTPTSTNGQLLAGWNRLATYPAYKVPNWSQTTIDEVGISAQNGMFAEPWMTGLPLSKYPFNQSIQSKWFTVACAFMKARHMKGIYYWGPWLGNYGGSLLKSPKPSDPSDIQPLAQSAIKACF